MFDPHGNQIAGGKLKLNLDRGDCEVTGEELGYISCSDIDLMIGHNDEATKAYNLIQVDLVKHESGSEIEIVKAEFEINFHKAAFKNYFNIFKLVFVAFSVINYCRFHARLNMFDRADLGIIQKWLQSLLLLLIFFNDPFCLLSNMIPWLYHLQ